MKLILAFLIGLSLLISMLPLAAVGAAASCSLCIVELQTQGQNGEESHDFIVVQNLSAIKMSSVELHYINDNNVSAGRVSLGTIEANTVKAYVSDDLSAMNPLPYASNVSLALFSGGGTVELIKGSTIYDKIGWGTAKSYEGVVSPAPPAGATLARKSTDAFPQDTNDNADDFQVVQSACRGAAIHEIQPFVADLDGRSIEAWVEVIGTSEEKGDCLLVTKAKDIYLIPGEYLPVAGETAVIDQGFDNTGQSVPLHIGEHDGGVWLTGISVYGSVKLPVVNQAYSNLANGQSYALFEEGWRRTYQPTPGAENVFRFAPDLFEDDPTACNSVRIAELLPNPDGEDAGREWIEVINEERNITPLTHCQIMVADTLYSFLPDDVLGLNERRIFYDLYDSGQNQKPLNLRNSGESLVKLQRLRADGTTEVVQSFAYADAPEGQSWARFDDGWRWQPPTPGLDNNTPPAVEPPPTESPAPIDPPASDGPVSSAVSITELLPNPASPGTDDADEFIELFNDSDEPVGLAGHKLQSGNSFSYSFTFTDQVIPAKGYLVVTSGNSNLSLANSGGKSRLLDTNGTVMSETSPYTDAPEGHAWALLDGTWRWTASPTPAEANKLRAPALTGLSKSKNTTPKTSGAVKSANKNTVPKAPKTPSAATTKPSNTNQDEAPTAAAIHPLVLAGVGSLAVLYAAYEYRKDFANRIYQFRRNRSARRENRAAAKGRRAD